MLYASNMENARNSLRQCNNQIVTYIAGVFHENAAIVGILARNDVVIHAGYGDPAAVVDIFESIHQSNSNMTYIYSGYNDGSLLINNYDEPQDYNSTSRPWYKAAETTDGVAPQVYSDAATGVWLFSQCMKLVDEHGNMVGAMAIDCSNESITQQLKSIYQYGSQRSFIVDSDGTVLIHPGESDINRNIMECMKEETWQGIVDGKFSYAEYVKDGISAMAYFAPIPETRFFVVTAINASEVTQPIIRSTAYLFLLIFGISIVLGVALSRILVMRFAQPIVELGERIQDLAEGRQRESRRIMSSNAEINSIADSIEVIVKDIAVREEQRKAAEYRSFHDSMTGLYNRRFFEEEVKRLDVRRNYPLCLICCDINGLKLTNDVFGHGIGDKLLITAARCLEKGYRGDDILARIGGDEFAAVMPHTGEADAELVIRRIKAGFPTESVCGAQVSVSLGFALKTMPEQTIEEVMRAADEMMYDQKIRESAEMKKSTIQNIIQAAEREGLIRPLTVEDTRLLERFADVRCPDSHILLKDSYRLRKIGLCTIILSLGYSPDVMEKRHAEIGYRILSSLDEYRNVAGCILHYMEHWDGSGWPVGLAGRDIPLVSRIMALVEGYFQCGANVLSQEKSGICYDPELVELLKTFTQMEEG